MPQKSTVIVVLIGVASGSILLLAGALLLPWSRVDWGKVEFAPSHTVTVTGDARTQQKNQIARYNAGVSSVNDNKDEAVAEVNSKVTAIVEAVKEFGITSDDIQTQNVNIFQDEDTYWEEGRQKHRPGQWRVSNAVEITLRDVDKAGKLSDLLSKSGANNVYGPNFSFDDTKPAQDSLLSEAIEDARQKAGKLAAASGKKLGKVINIVEGGAVGPGPFMLKEAGGGGGMPIEPGTGTIFKSVTVTFDLD